MPLNSARCLMIPGAKLCIFENSSHTIRADEPHALIDAIVDFVDMG